MRLSYSPLKIEILREGQVQVILNDRGLMHLEHYRKKPEPFPTVKQEDQEVQQLVFQRNKRSILSSTSSAQYDDTLVSQWAGFEEEDQGEWEETWASRRDSKPKGPEALALDMTFPGILTSLDSLSTPRHFLFAQQELLSVVHLPKTRRIVSMSPTDS